MLTPWQISEIEKNFAKFQEELKTFSEFPDLFKYFETHVMQQAPSTLFKDGYNPAYDETTRRVAQKKAREGCFTQSQIKTKLQSIPAVDPKFLKGVQTGNFSLITEVKEYPRHALKAFEQGLITREDFATIQMFWASKDDEKECVPLFIKNIWGADSSLKCNK